MKNKSGVVAQVAILLLPVVVVFGIYIVLSGADSVGGGFQGGAVLSTIYMLLYLIEPEKYMDNKIRMLQVTEKVFMLGLLVLALSMLGQTMQFSLMMSKAWLLLMNIIIATKVFCGLGIIFLRFIIFEGK